MESNLAVRLEFLIEMKFWQGSPMSKIGIRQ